MEIQILGPLRVRDDGSELVVGASALRRLVTRLAVSAPEGVSADRLAEDLGLSPGGLRTAVSRLRKIVGDSVVTEPPGYALSGGRVDAAQFETMVAQALETAPAEQVVLFDEALDLWRGVALAEFADDPWAQPEVARLDELRALAREARVQAKLDLGRHTEVVSELNGMIADYPLRDGPRRQMMLALAGSGRRTEALRCFQEYRQLLADEIGTEPGAELWQLDAEIAASDAAPIGSPSDRRSNLPLQRSSFFGRERELGLIAAALSGNTVVTLTGVGGVGKTRLALQAGEAALHQFRDGVWFLNLAASSDLAGIAEVVASTLDIQQQGADLMDSLTGSLKGREILLLLDNCEHLLDEAAEFVECIVDSCEAVVILATSREGLAVEGEQIVAVPSLAVPESAEEETDAVRLFVDRAAALVGSFELTADNRGAVAAICRRLDGIPLAIELAAARVPSMTPDEIVDHLDERFRLLTGGRRRSRERHQTLRQTIDWSYELLDGTTQATMLRLAVFGGSFDVAAAEAVTDGLGLSHAAVLDVLMDLVGKSLLVAEPTGAQTRYRYLETIRQYGEERLEESGELDSTSHLAAEHFTSWAETAVQNVIGPNEREWGDRLDLELPNLRRLVDRAIDLDEPGIALRLLAPFHRTLNGQGDRLTRLALNILDAGAPLDDPDLIKVMTMAAHEYLVRGEYHSAVALCDDAILLAEEMGRPPLPTTLNSKAMSQGFTGKSEAALATITEGVRAARDADDEVWVVMNLCGQVGWSAGSGRPEAARSIEMAEEAWLLAKTLNYPTAMAATKWTLGTVTTPESPERALEHFLEGMAIDPGGGLVTASLAAGAALAAARTGDPARATAQVIPHFRQWEREHNQMMITYFTLGAAMAALANGEPDTSARLAGFGEAIWELGTVDARDELYSGLTEELGKAQFEALLSEGGAMSFDEALEVLHTYLDHHHQGWAVE